MKKIVISLVSFFALNLSVFAQFIENVSEEPLKNCTVHIKNEITTFSPQKVKPPEKKDDDSANKLKQENLKKNWETKYIEAIKYEIKQNWQPPKAKETTNVITVFRISKDGKLISNKICQSSGSKKNDESALAAINGAAPFKAFPQESESDFIDIEFTFSYNVFPFTNQDIKPILEISPNADSQFPLLQEAALPFAPFPDGMNEDTMTPIFGLIYYTDSACY